MTCTFALGSACLVGTQAFEWAAYYQANGGREKENNFLNRIPCLKSLSQPSLLACRVCEIGAYFFVLRWLDHWKIPVHQGQPVLHPLVYLLIFVTAADGFRRINSKSWLHQEEADKELKKLLDRCYRTFFPVGLAFCLISLPFVAIPPRAYIASYVYLAWGGGIAMAGSTVTGYWLTKKTA